MSLAPWFPSLRRRRKSDDALRESARRKLAEAEARGPLYAAIIRGEACCQVNDPEYSREAWVAALYEYERLVGVTA